MITGRRASGRLTALSLVLAILAVLVAGCGSGDGTATTRGVGRAGKLRATDLPDVSLVDVASGEKVRLRSLLPTPLPLLVWAWAPH